MYFDGNVARATLDAERAEEDSLLFWRELRAIGGKSRSDDMFQSLASDGETLMVNLPGRYQIGDANEYACEILSISPNGIRIKGPECGSVGKWSTLDITSVGIASGLVVDSQNGQFTLGVISSPRRLRRFAERLQWRLDFVKGEVVERRASERIEMNHASAMLETQDGQRYPCELFDISDGGAAVHLGAKALYFWPDQPVVLNARAGRVLRSFPGGVVVKFD